MTKGEAPPLPFPSRTKEKNKGKHVLGRDRPSLLSPNVLITLRGFLLVIIHPTLLPRKSNTASVDLSFQSHLTELGYYHPHAFPMLSFPQPSDLRHPCPIFCKEKVPGLSLPTSALPTPVVVRLADVVL